MNTMDVVSLCNGPTLPCVWVRVYCPLQSAVWYSAECLMLPIKERTKKALLELLLCNPRRTYTHTHTYSVARFFTEKLRSAVYIRCNRHTHTYTPSLQYRHCREKGEREESVGATVIDIGRAIGQSESRVKPMIRHRSRVRCLLPSRHYHHR